MNLNSDASLTSKVVINQNPTYAYTLLPSSVFHLLRFPCVLRLLLPARIFAFSRPSPSLTFPWTHTPPPPTVTSTTTSPASCGRVPPSPHCLPLSHPPFLPLRYLLLPIPLLPCYSSRSRPFFPLYPAEATGGAHPIFSFLPSSSRVPASAFSPRSRLPVLTLTWTSALSPTLSSPSSALAPFPLPSSALSSSSTAADTLPLYSPRQQAPRPPPCRMCMWRCTAHLGNRAADDWDYDGKAYSTEKAAVADATGSKRADRAGDKQLTLPGREAHLILDGPYGGSRVLLFAGGSGATFTLGVLDELVGRVTLPLGAGCEEVKTTWVVWCWCVRSFGAIS
ncbi:hypothetical protein DFH09DRAFT_1335256 [Mycena vulgaris]|nr:hypothetical protein DFH09DRAFT_1335256 [Mycena vulgaris]